jgi:hypothetical protein
MEYFRDTKGLIQSDLAFRLKSILFQYHSLDFSVKYEITLCISILQTLLTNCVELLESLENSNKKIANPLTEYPINKKIWGFNESVIKSNFHQDNNIKNVIWHLRNALSHPTGLNLNEQNLTTGYTTNNKSTNIESLVFVTSPDRRSDGSTMSYPTDISKKPLKFFPNDIIVENRKGKHFFYQNGEPFHRIFQIELSTESLFKLTYALATYLSHPLKENWDGKTFEFENLMVA